MKEAVTSFFSFLSESLFNLLPSNAVVFVFYLAGVFILSLLIIKVFSVKAGKEKNVKSSLKMDDLIKVASSSSTSSEELFKALVLFYDNFEVKNKEKESFVFLEKVLNHPNRTKKLFDFFHEKILPKNIYYEKKLNELEKKALNNKL
ncbi:hypothetical protein [Nautilia sp.]